MVNFTEEAVVLTRLSLKMGEKILILYMWKVFGFYKVKQHIFGFSNGRDEILYIFVDSYISERMILLSKM